MTETNVYRRYKATCGVLERILVLTASMKELIVNLNY